MQRRQFLSLAVVGLGGCVSASGGSGPRNPPTTPEGGGPVEEARSLRILDSEPREGDDGALVLAITVENTADGARSDTLVASATAESGDGATEYEASREISVDAGDEAEFELVFEVSYDEWADGDGSLAYGWEGEL
ncbi:MAG: hypothetical protein ACOCSD_03240 [Halolamina sp.]